MTEEKNSNSESKEQQPKNERHFNQDQYDRLIKCSKKGPKGIEEWNKWRDENPSEQIWLQKANLINANLQGGELWGVKLQGAKLAGAKLQGAKLSQANLQRADFFSANLEGAELLSADLQGAQLQWAKLQGADLWFAKLQGANLLYAKLQGAKFMGPIVDGSTCFLYCEIDENTDFRHTGLENTRIESGTKYRLKYNIRRMNWKDWYTKHRFLQCPVKLFWSISNYGISTLRIIAWFFGLAIAFALVYYFVPGLIKDLHGTGNWYSDLVRACYFSVVTMTTLGFGDMFANKQSMTGHILLIVQVIWGYVLLGALVTRLAVLFTSDGPAGEFAKDKKARNENPELNAG